MFNFFTFNHRIIFDEKTILLQNVMKTVVVLVFILS